VHVDESGRYHKSGDVYGVASARMIDCSKADIGDATPKDADVLPHPRIPSAVEDAAINE
jgi:hypothetical protein